MNRFLPLLAVLSLSACAGAQLEKQKKEIEDLQTKAGSLYSQLQERAGEAETLKAQKAELEAKLAEAEGKIAAAENRASALSSSNKSLSDAIGASKDELGGRLNAVVAEKDALSKRLSDTLKEKLALERLKTVYQSAREKTARDLAKLSAERDAILAKLTKAEGAVAQSGDAAKAAAEAKSAAVLRTREEMGAAADSVLKEMQDGAARLDQAGESFLLTLSDSSLFDEGEAKLTERGEALLSRVGAALKAIPGKHWRVEAHSDNSAFKKGLLGGYAGHWELTAARATAVARWLHEHAGLDPARLSAAGFGEFRPAKPNDSAEGRKANRRVVIEVAPVK
ncbi:MAG: OmpA family protein [Elusimicrobiota bacterium]|nr:MAG: OmpA family protein [Elusimicrobiota bacterium]